MVNAREITDMLQAAAFLEMGGIPNKSMEISAMQSSDKFKYCPFLNFNHNIDNVASPKHNANTHTACLLIRVFF